MPGCNFPKKNPGESGENDGGGEQDNRIEQAIPDNRSYRLTVMKGNAQISGDKVFEIIDILDPYGLIEPQLGNEMLCVFRRHVRVHDPGNRVARAQAEQDKEHRQDDKKDDKYFDEPFEDEFSNFHAKISLYMNTAEFVINCKIRDMKGRAFYPFSISLRPLNPIRMTNSFWDDSNFS